MRQSSERFMDEMLKDNAAPKEGQSIEEIIDQKLEQAMSKLTEQLTKVTEPKSEGPENNNLNKEDNEHVKEGNGAGSEEGASEETDN